MKKTWRLLTTTLLMAVIACGLGITASASEIIPETGLTVPTTEYGADIQEGTTVYTAGSGTVTVTVDKTAQTIKFALNNATIEGTDYGISFGDRWASCPTTITLTGDNTITVTGENGKGISGQVTSPFTLAGDGNLTINALNGTGGYGIQVTAPSTEVKLTNTGKLTVNTTGTGISFLASNDVVFSNSSLTINAGQYGVSFVGLDTGSCTLPSGTIHATTGVGVSASAGDLTVPEGCTITSDGGYGIALSPTSSNTLALNSDCDAVYLYDGATIEGSGTATLLAVRNSSGDATTATLQKSATFAGNLSQLLSNATKLNNQTSGTPGKETLSLIIKNGATLTIPSGATAYLDPDWDSTANTTIFGTVTVNGNIQNNGTLYIGNNSKVTTGAGGNTIVGGAITIDGVKYIRGGDITETGFDFATNPPSESICYTAGEGYLLFNKTGNTITLNNTTFGSDSENTEFRTGDIETILIEGSNTLRHLYTPGGGTLASTASLTIQGKGENPVLSLSGAKHAGVYAGQNLTIQDCTVNLADSCYLSGSDGVTITNSVVNITGTDSTYTAYGITSYSGSISITDSIVDVNAETFGIHSINGNIAINGTGSTKVTMQTADTMYEAISAETGITVGDSVALTVTSAKHGLRCDTGNIDISTTGDVNISTTRADNYGIYTVGDTTATISKAKLTITDNSIKAKNIVIKDGASVTLATLDIESGDSISISGGGTLETTRDSDTVNDGTISISDSGKLTVTELVNTGTLSISDSGVLSATHLTNTDTISIDSADTVAGLSIAGNGTYKFDVDAPVEDMINVPNTSDYTSEAKDVSSSIYLKKVTQTIGGIDFTLINSEWFVSGNKVTNTGWDYTITDEDGNTIARDAVTNAGEYTVTYSKGTDFISKTFTVRPANMDDTTSSEKQTAILIGDSVALPTAPTATTKGDNAITVKYSGDEGETYALDEMTFTTAGLHTVYYQISAPNHNDIESSLYVEVIALTFFGSVTSDTSVTYGNTWASILPLGENTYSAREGNTNVTGTYTLKIDGADYDTATIPNVKANSGTYEWVVTFTSTPDGDGLSTYTDVVADSGYMTIKPIDLTDAMVSVGTGYTYTSEAIEPVTVANGSTDLVKDTDYTVDYESNTNAGSAKATVGGIGNYSGTIVKSFTIEQASLAIDGISVAAKEYDGTKDIADGDYEIIWNGVQGEDTIQYYGSVNWYAATAGTNTITYSLTLTGESDTNYKLTVGTVQDTDPYNDTTITQRAVTITAADQEVTYGTDIATGVGKVSDTDTKLLTGHTISEVTLTQNSVNVTPDTDEALTITPSGVTIWDGDDNDVTANYTITYANGLLTISAKSLDNEMIGTIADQVYTGSAIEPAITVTDSEATITTNDYEVAYSNNTVAGTATVTITGKNNYTGTASKTFTIVQSGTVFTGGVTADDYTPTYGDTIHIYVTPTATGTAPAAVANGLSRAFAAPTANQMALFIGSTQITEPQDVTEGMKLTFTINTTDKALVIGPNTITAKYTEGDNMASQEGTVVITLGKKALSATLNQETGAGAISKEYDGDNAFSDNDGADDIHLAFTEDADPTATGKLVSGDVVIATVQGYAASFHVGADQTFITDVVSNLGGADADYYTVAASDVTGTVSIYAKALTITTLAQEVTYGTAISSETTDVDVVGLIEGETLRSIALTESDKNVATADKTVNAATAIIKSGDEIDVTANYDITYTNTGVLTINSLTAILSWPEITSFVYDNSEKSIEATVLNAVDGDTFSITYDGNKATTAGSYTAKVTDLGNDNYTLPTTVTKGFTIEKAPVTFTLNADGTVTASPDKVFSVQYVSSKGEASSAIPTDSGSYTVNVTLTDGDNYRVTGSGTATATIGTYTKNAKSYTATFGTETFTTLEKSTLIVPAGTDKSASEVFAGWTLDDITYKAGEVFTQPSKNVEFEAVYQAVHNIDGYVYAYNTTDGIEGVVVTLMQGSKQIKQATTGENGAYDFGYVAEGIYNVVAAYDSTTKTELADISATDAHVNITMPEHKTSSVVEVTAGTPDVIVGGLDEIAANEIGNDTTAVVEVKLSVEQTSTTNAAIEEKASNVGMYLNIDVSKTVDGTEETGYNTTSGLVELIIPIPAAYQGKASYSIFREHEGEVTELKLGTEGERIEIEGTNLHLFAKHFSTYALAYTEYSSGGGISYYTSSVATSDNGDVTISSTKNKMNATVTITATPNEGYEVGDVSVTYSSGREVSVTDNGDGTYSYKQPGASVSVKVTFVEIGAEYINLFTDVAEGAYYYDAVQWAVTNGITNGTTATTFSPDMTCTRAQAVTLLWKAYGSPIVERENPFTDVAEGAYYYEAVLWAVSEGITNGTTATTFSPNADCTRSQIVTFLWNAAEKPVVNYLMTFEDVASDTWYAEAVRWAVSEGITSGTTATTFDPTANCTRGQIVTFLYRNLAK